MKKIIEIFKGFWSPIMDSNVNPLKTLTIGARAGAHLMDLHGRAMTVAGRNGAVHPIAFNLA